MRALIALKFNAGLHTEKNEKKGWEIGHAKYPDFNQVSLETRKNMDWSHYIDAFGIGMQYDKACGHKEEGDTPFGEQCCVIAVPEDVAIEALKLFPEDLTRLTPKVFETFYNDKAHAHESGDHIDKEVLDAIKAKEDLSIDVPEKVNALDRNHSDRGIRKNHNKTWSDFKVKAGVEIV